MKPRGYLLVMKGMLEPRVRMYSVAKASAGWIRGISPSFTEGRNVLCDSQSGSKILVAGRLLHHLFVLLLLHFLRRNGVSGSCALLLVQQHVANTHRVCHEPFLRSLFREIIKETSIPTWQPTIRDANCAAHNHLRGETVQRSLSHFWYSAVFPLSFSKPLRTWKSPWRATAWRWFVQKRVLDM